jgi:hypothetical protein
LFSQYHSEHTTNQSLHLLGAKLLLSQMKQCSYAIAMACSLLQLNHQWRNQRSTTYHTVVFIQCNPSIANHEKCKDHYRPNLFVARCHTYTPPLTLGDTAGPLLSWSCALARFSAPSSTESFPHGRASQDTHSREYFYA